MPTMIEITCKFDGQSLHGSYMEHMKHRWAWWLIIRSIAALAMLGTGVYMMAHGYGGKWKLIASGLVVFGALSVVRPMLWQMMQERSLRKLPGYGSTTTYGFDATGVSISGAAGQGQFPWSTFYEVVERKKGILLYQNKQAYLWIPRFAFEKAGVEMTKITRLHQQYTA